ncbi:MAG: hypothetical protein ACYST3_10070 [Planctomycetota bacterium]|jgi:hypothetical protein
MEPHEMEPDVFDGADPDLDDTASDKEGGPDEAKVPEPGTEKDDEKEQAD